MKPAVILLALATTACGVSAAPKAKPGDRTFIESVRPLQANGRTICTTTSIDNDLDLWLTARHCVEGGTDQLTIDGKAVVEVIGLIEEDLSVLRAIGTTVAAVELAPESPKRGDYIQMYGYPVGYDGDYFQGYISNLAGTIEGYDGLWMRFDMTGCGGNSGSAVMDKYGRIVSVLSFGHGRPCDGFSGGALYEDVVKAIKAAKAYRYMFLGAE